MAIDQEYYFALPRRELVHRTRIRSSQEVLKSHFCNDKRLSLYKRRPSIAANSGRLFRK